MQNRHRSGVTSTINLWCELKEFYYVNIGLFGLSQSNVAREARKC